MPITERDRRHYSIIIIRLILFNYLKIVPMGDLRRKGGSKILYVPHSPIVHECSCRELREIFLSGEHVLSDLSNKGQAKGSSFQDLFARLVSGDPTAEKELYSLIGRGVKARLQFEFRDQQEDTHHEVFLAVVRAIRRGSINQPSAIPGYVISIIKRKKSELIKAKKRDTADYDLSLIPSDPSARVDARLLANQRLNVLERAVARLSTEEQVLIRRYYICELSTAEVSAELGVSEGQFRMRKHRALAKLRARAKMLVDLDARR